MSNKIIKKGIIYIIENLNDNNFKYIGQTTETLNKRWSNHLSKIKQFDRMYYRLNFFINLHGIDKYNIREYKIYNNITQNILDNEEQKYIFKLGTLNTIYSNDNITIKITNDLQNDFINMFINKNIEIHQLYTLIDTFKYNYKREKSLFILNKCNDSLINKLLYQELSNKLLNMEIRTTPNYSPSCDGYYYLKIPQSLLDDDMIIEDYIKYIEYFNDNFEISNNINDIYYSSDLIYGLTKYGDAYDLFDFYLIIDFKKIIQCYFDIINKSYKNVIIKLNENILYGIKKKIPISFKLYYEIENFIDESLHKINNSNNQINDDNYYSIYGDFIDNNYNDDNYDILDEKIIKNNKLYISTLDSIIYRIWESKSNLEYDYFDDDNTTDNIIMINKEYSYDYNNLDLLDINLIVNSIIKYFGEYKIVENKYIMLTYGGVDDEPEEGHDEHDGQDRHDGHDGQDRQDKHDRQDRHDRQDEQQIILNENVIETTIKNKYNIINEKPLLKTVKNKKLSYEEQKNKHENKKEYLREYYNKNRNEINKINKINSKDKYYNRLVRELNNNVINFENMRATTIEKWGIKYNKDTKLYYSTLIIK